MLSCMANMQIHVLAWIVSWTLRTSVVARNTSAAPGRQVSDEMGHVMFSVQYLSRHWTLLVMHVPRCINTRDLHPDA